MGLFRVRTHCPNGVRKPCVSATDCPCALSLFCVRANEHEDAMVHLGTFVQACANLLAYTSGSGFQQLLATLEHLIGLMLVDFPRTGYATR